MYNVVKCRTNSVITEVIDRELEYEYTGTNTEWLDQIRTCSTVELKFILVRFEKVLDQGGSSRQIQRILYILDVPLNIPDCLLIGLYHGL